ncbi:FAD-dependent dehydrogenase [Ignavibacterium album JCM 16511]|uniref:FAD-dependent dehydrogenase n=1 Tax=Ignavibacterium album (strain DSM 19864 / JCM 16511 / NBRC 101810 / Mat9-16) TaxID=945713 RepID=I0AJ32_IGNAJ|nr:FAD-dependent oxidoreductase [Ignavibacterium album]AFH48989.1 FAD-dependent dehydrogenase [Ignavibacterium album JCM 16511]
MKKQIELAIPPEKISVPNIFHIEASKFLSVPAEKISAVIPLRRSIDARSKKVVFRFLVDVYLSEIPQTQTRIIDYKQVSDKQKVIIIGFGPAGMYAALRLIEFGIKPIVIERGKDVQSRRRDIRAIHQEQIVNPNSNYCFGEGGAGAYSDGKLYTRATKRGDVKKVLEILVQHGADPEILIDTHPHIGSNKLPKIVQQIRQTILNCDGEIHFDSKVTDFIIQQNKILGVVVKDSKELLADAVILATGHSARDIFYLLHKKNILIQPKPFALGVRIEHPQALINEIQYHTKEKHPNLPAASYSLACNVNDRGVYSFCMCPGGIIVPASTAQNEIVVNGMSVSRRDSPFANSGFVVEVTEQEYHRYEKHFPFNALQLQMDVEQKCYELANNTQKAPAQKVTDFVEGKFSSSLPKSSYIAGLTSVELHKELPSFITKRLKTALKIFDRRMHGYYSNEAIIVAPESRTSSPIRVPRDKETFMHIQIERLFPCGEGAGYAGGIVSAAIDGENCANAVKSFVECK